jgi:hypothetical protein
LNCSTSSHG